MSLIAGTRLGPYEILAPIGAGGMGQVWSARDTRLDRIVAIKVSAEQFSERFEQEARHVAALNHPNICTLFDVGPDYLVMELVEGPTLAERIAAGPIALDEALAIARQIAEALEAAHERGIVHRDLKPANVKLTSDDKVKVLDFGLAKAREPQGTAGDPTLSPTMTISATRAGMIIGTAGYMSPEQARGKPVDRRADIWSFGVVLYEMLCGRQLYSGELPSDLLAAVILKDPDWEPLPAGTPPRIRELLQRCLRKDPKMRLRDIGDARIAIDEYLAKPDAPAAAIATPAVSAGSRRIPMWLVASAAVLALALAALAAIHFSEKPAPQAVVRFQLASPEKPTFGNGLALSPDGKRVVYSHAGADGVAKLWVRSLDSLAAQPLTGTDEAGFPFWSPDSRYIGYFARGQVKKIEASGGPPQTLCDYSNTAIGGSWNGDGVILFGTNASGLFRVPQAGGAASPVTILEGELFHGRPWFLPDGKRFFYFVNAKLTEKSGIYLAALGSSGRKFVVAAKQGAMYVDARTSAGKGHLLFLREGTLMALPLDPRSLDPAGDAFPVAEQVGFSISSPFFSVSANGVLAYRNGGATGHSQLAWFDRDGKPLGTVGPAGAYNDLSLSPDGKWVAVSRGDAAGGPGATRDIWLIDAVHGVPTRFTFDPAAEVNAIWSPDSSRVVFASARTGIFNLYQRAAGGVGGEEPLLKSDLEARPYDWSDDGKFLVFSVVDNKTRSDLWVLPDPAGSGERKPRPFLASPFNETEGQFSPASAGSTRWLAYVSDESGKDEVYVQPFAETPIASAAKFQISSDGGYQPRWRRDGKELFYLYRGRIMAVEIKTTPRFEHGIPKPLFESRILGSIPALRTLYRYAVSGDGKRFLVDGQEEESVSSPITVVLNWNAALK
jgi:eukaryotic-like serine/threonine-protein kinase